MTITLDQARGIVRGVQPLPGAGNPEEDDVLNKPPTGGGTTSGTGSIEGPTFDQASGDRYVTNINDAITRVNAGTYTGADLVALQQAGLITAAEASKYVRAGGATATATGGTGSGAGSSSVDTGPGYLDLAMQKFVNDLTQQGVQNNQWDQQFGQNQITGNRNELANRASSGGSTGNLLLDLATRSDRLANDPGNFPAWLQAMQQNTAQGPVAQNLVNAGTTITPAPNDYLNTPEFKSLIDSLFNYGTVPDAGMVDTTQKAYNTNPDAAQTFFSQDPANLKKMFGTPMATGGSFTTSGPMTFKDLSSGKNIATAGEAGPETVSVTPQTGQASASQGTAQALGKTLGAGGFSFVPPDTRNTLLAGNLPAPGQFPDWMLAKLPPSIRGLVAALITSRLGGAGAEDYNWTRGLYEPRGFSGAGGVVR